MSLYISKERTLFILMYLYHDGNLEKALAKEFLKEIKLDYRLLFKIFQAVLYVIRFYAIISSNRQTSDRYYTFFALFANEKPRIISSIDF